MSLAWVSEEEALERRNSPRASNHVIHPDFEPDIEIHPDFEPDVHPDFEPDGAAFMGIPTLPPAQDSLARVSMPEPVRRDSRDIADPSVAAELQDYAALSLDGVAAPAAPRAGASRAARERDSTAPAMSATAAPRKAAGRPSLHLQNGIVAQGRAAVPVRAAQAQAQAPPRAGPTPPPAAPAGGAAISTGTGRTAAAAVRAKPRAASLAGDIDSLDTEALRYRLRKAEAGLHECEAQLAHWRHGLGRILTTVLLNPAMNEFYKSTLAKTLCAILPKVPQIERVCYVDASFPSVATRAPKVDLLKWEEQDADDGGEDGVGGAARATGAKAKSAARNAGRGGGAREGGGVGGLGDRWVMRAQYAVDWAPAWTIALGVEGRHFLVPFSLKISCHSFQLCGRMHAAFSAGMTHTRVSFPCFPGMDVAIDADLKSGVVPVPVHAAISSLVRSTCNDWVEKNLVAPKGMVFPCLRARSAELSDADVRKAREAALAASRITSMRR
eukprot:g7403.t1